MSAPVHGTCDEIFAKVRDVFERSFESGEIGAAVAVLIDGEPVIDLWGGWVDEGRTRPWERDTLVNVDSVTKGMASMCLNRHIEHGLLDLDRGGKLLAIPDQTGAYTCRWVCFCSGVLRIAACMAGV